MPENPNVIVDFVFQDGLLFLSLKNISDKPVYKVTTKFDRKLLGNDGKKDITTQAMFRNVEFLAPRKEIVTFVDTSSNYFKNKQPELVRITINYRDSEDALKKVEITHNLDIYKEIAYIQK